MQPSVFKITSAASVNLTQPLGTVPSADLYGYEIYNTNVAARFVKFYWGAPGTFSGGGDTPTVGTDVPKITIQVPATGKASSNYACPVGGPGTMFMAMTVNAADTDATAVGAGDLIASIFVG